jgi:hypothetical protein
MQRRHFMRLGLAGSLMLPGLALGRDSTPESMRWLRVNDAWAAPVATTGDWLATDAGITVFDGEGLYLYPAWGQPRPYLVRSAGPDAACLLEFCNPGTGQVLWTDTQHVHFAGRVCGLVPAQIETWLGHLPQRRLLELPRLPA